MKRSMSHSEYRPSLATIFLVRLLLRLRRLVVATTAAIFAKPLGDILLKAVKPIVKKTIKKIKEKLGKKVKVESFLTVEVSAVLRK